MHIHGTSHIHGPHGINAPHAPFRGPSESKAVNGPAADQVQISPAAQAAVDAAEHAESRQSLISRIRSELAAGTYETPEKLSGAVDRLLDEIG